MMSFRRMGQFPVTDMYTNASTSEMEALESVNSFNSAQIKQFGKLVGIGTAP